MDAYAGLIGALLGAGLTGLLALLLDRQRGEREAVAAREQRDHDRRERRYEDRLDAYAAFEAEVVTLVRNFRKFIDQHDGLTPEDEEWEPTEPVAMNDALIRVRFVASPEAAAAATQLAEFMQVFIHSGGSADELTMTWERFRAAARADVAGA